MENEKRIDFIDEEYMQSVFKPTAEGYLEGRAIVTNIGVFPYVMADGSIRREARIPEEVFSSDSIHSLKLKPITNNHPMERVTAENIKEYQIGFTGDKIEYDSYHLSAPMSITDQETIMDVNNGKRAFSCGYSVDIDPTPGNFMGMAYDAIQRNIRYNHIAVVDQGRAGDAARMKLDSAEKIGLLLREDQSNIDSKQKELENSNDKKDGGSVMEQNVKIDGVDYKVDKDVKKYIHQLETKNDELQKMSETEIKQLKEDTAKIEAERDQYKDDADKFKKELEDSKEVKGDEFDKAVDARIQLLASAGLAEVEIKSDMSEIDIKKEVVKKVSPSAIEKLDSADDIYIQARFDLALEKLEELKKDKQDVANILKKDSLKNDSSEEKSTEDYKKDMVDYAVNLWKTKGKEDK